MSMRTVTFKLCEKDLENLDRFSKRVGLSRSEIIRLLIECLISHKEYSCSILRQYINFSLGEEVGVGVVERLRVL